MTLLFRSSIHVHIKAGVISSNEMERACRCICCMAGEIANDTALENASRLVSNFAEKLKKYFAELCRQN